MYGNLSPYQIGQVIINNGQVFIHNGQVFFNNLAPRSHAAHIACSFNPLALPPAPFTPLALFVGLGNGQERRMRRAGIACGARRQRGK